VQRDARITPSTPAAARRQPIIAVWCALALCGAALEIALTIREAAHGWFGDFPHYYVAAARVGVRTPYGPLTPADQSALALDPERYPVYRNYPADPPTTIALLSPLALLPFGSAWAALTAVSAVILFGALHATARSVGFSRPAAIAAAATAFATIPGRGLLLWGHMEGLVLLAIVLGWLAFRAGRNAAGAAWWVAAASLKAFPALLLIPAVSARRDNRTVAGAAAAACAIAAGTTAVLGADIWQIFATEVVPLAANWGATVGNLSLLGVFGSFGLSPGIARAATAAIGAAAIAWLIARPGSPDRWLIAGTALSLLLSPLVWVFYDVLVFPALIAMAASLEQARSLRALAFVALALVLALWPAYLPVAGASMLTALSACARPLALGVVFVWGMRLGADELRPGT
jgi:hypothetical protein